MECETNAGRVSGQATAEPSICGGLRAVLIPLKLVRDLPLQQQLYDQLRGLIDGLRLSPGSRMPSSRMLAEQFAISRVTVLLAYERLIAEGYLVTLPAKGTFVARKQEARTDAVKPAAHQGDVRPLPAGGMGRVGRPDPSLFPAGRWKALMRGALDHLGAHVGAEHTAGNPALRSAIAGWLSVSRGLAVTPEQILLVNSRAQALMVAAHLAVGPRAKVVVEDPCDPDAVATLTHGGGEVVRVPVDAEGLRTDCLPDGDAALIHVTPEHQRPLGVSLARCRRLELLDWATRASALVLEEDCEGELRYGLMNIPSLMSLDTADRVILLSGFGVSLGPWLSLGYLVLPRRLIGAGVAVRRLIDDSHGSLEESALAEFLSSGGYALHLHRLGKSYASRRDALVTALELQFGITPKIWGEHAGLRLTWFPQPETGRAATLAVVARRCGLDAAEVLGLRGAAPGNAEAVLLGFGGLEERQLQQRVAQFAAMLRDGAAGTMMAAD